MRLVRLWLLALLPIAGVVLFSTLWAAPPQNYSLGFTFKNPDGTVFRIIKYHLRDGGKYRVAYLSGDGAANAVEIYRKDKGLIWSLDPASKTYKATALTQEAWVYAVAGPCAADSQMQKKTGTAQFLKRACDVYETEKDGWLTISLVEQGTHFVLRSETKQNGQLVQTMAATEYSLAKPAAALFELPAGYAPGQ